MNPTQDENRASVAKAARELRQLEKQTEKARRLLARLQAGLIDAGNKLGGEAALLAEANQQLVLSALHRQADAAESSSRAALQDAAAVDTETTGEANQLLEANEQLVIAILNAQTDTDIATANLAKVEQSLELEVVTRASQSKSEFLSRVSHELRTPLNAILGFSHLMLMDDDECGYLDAAQRERVEAIRMAGQHLLSLTNDMLDLSRIEHGRVRIDMQPVDVYTLIHSSEILLRPSAQEYNIEVRNLSRPDEYRVMADERALGQVLLNLISNAIKYNRPDGWVTVNTKLQRDEVIIVVEDNGVGMSPAQLTDLFQPFNRLGAEQGSMPGCGLGLVISKALVELMGGKIGVSSVEGRGTTMEIRLCKSIAFFSLPTNSAEAEPLAAKPITTTRTILYVEDNPVNAMIMQQLIAAEPAWSLSIATTGQMGIELAMAQRPSLIILDMQLPDMTGQQVLRAPQEQNIVPPKSCIALSADAMPEQVATAMKAGFSQYWTKPLDMQQALNSLREILQADAH